MRRKRTIPCKECLVLPICKQKVWIDCILLFNYMKVNTTYETGEAGKRIKNRKGNKAWNEVNKLFRREEEAVKIVMSKGSRDNIYKVEPLQYYREREGVKNDS